MFCKLVYTRLDVSYGLRKLCSPTQSKATKLGATRCVSSALGPYSSNWHMLIIFPQLS